GGLRDQHHLQHRVHGGALADRRRGRARARLGVGQARRRFARAHRRRWHVTRGGARLTQPGWRSALAYAFGLATVILGLYGLDTLSAPRVPAAAAAPAPATTNGA